MKEIQMSSIFPKKRLFDSHAHLDMLDGYLKSHVDQAVASGVVNIVTMGTDIKSSLKSVEYQKRFKGVVIAGVGIHPEIVIPGSESYNKALDIDKLSVMISKIQEIITSNDVYVLGECGLDYYYLHRNKKLHSKTIERSKSLQQFLLKEQLKLAKLLNLTVSIHARDAIDDTINLCKMYAKDCNIIFHSFTGNTKQAKEILSLGYKIGVNGIITFKKAEDLRNTIKEITKEKNIRTIEDLYNAGIYLETDCPFLLPINSKNKEKQNSPKQLPYIWEFITENILV